MNTTDFNLANGLRVILHTDASAPLVTFNVLYNVGSADDPPGGEGYAHLFEHLMFDRSAHMERGEYDVLCAMAGGENNAWTSSDFTNYWIALPAEQFELGLWLESDRMIEYSVEEDSLETQKGVVIAEKRQVMDNLPYGSSDVHIRQMLFRENHPYRHEPIGREDHIRDASTESLQRFFDSYYHPSNATFVVAGNFDPNVAAERIPEYFDPVDRPIRECPKNTSPIANLHGDSPARRTIADAITPLNAAFLGWRGPSTESDDALALDILQFALADGSCSRLTQGLEYDPEVASETGVIVEEGLLGSACIVYAIAANNEVPGAELRDRILGEIHRVARYGISKSEWNRVLNRKTTAVARAMQSYAYRAEQLGWYTAVFGDPLLLFSELERISSIRLEHVVDVARRYLVDVDPVWVDYRAVTNGKRARRGT